MSCPNCQHLSEALRSAQLRATIAEQTVRARDVEILGLKNKLNNRKHLQTKEDTCAWHKLSYPR